ncbi:transposase [Melghiribacillus thermohalophilus]|uniref:transposase n=1 Tax=Melghiribacillus thermohalophilus TaxID=1324956 RepID=UPI003C711F52
MCPLCFQSAPTWKEPILNYFRFRLANAKLEGTNNTLKRRSFGCPNLEKFDRRISVECQQPAWYLEAIIR